MDIEIKKRTDNVILLNDFGFKVESVTVESIEIEKTTKQRNTNGRIRLSTQYRKRNIKVECYVISTKQMITLD